MFSTFEFDAICLIDFLARILINGFFEFWTSVQSLIFENSRSNFMTKLYVEVDAIVASISILRCIALTGLLR